MGLIIGFSSFRFAIESYWENAVICIVVASTLDAIDGRVARILKVSSHFGAELDTLCDFVNFGVSPAIVTYLWVTSKYECGSEYWIIVLFFLVCMAIRLARFNTILHCGQSRYSKHFFVGVPAPLGSIVFLIPIMLDFNDVSFLNNIQAPIYIAVYHTFVALSLASSMPVFSIKYISVKYEYLWCVMIAIFMLIISVMMYPWHVIPAIGIIYISTIPLSIIRFKKICISKAHILE